MVENDCQFCFAPACPCGLPATAQFGCVVTKKTQGEERGIGSSSTDPSSSTPSTRRLASSQRSETEASASRGRRHYALVAAKDGGPAAFVDRREATKLPDTHLKTWESKSKS